MGGFGVKVQHFPLTLLVVLTTLTLPCERDKDVTVLGFSFCGHAQGHSQKFVLGGIKVRGGYKTVE